MTNEAENCAIDYSYLNCSCQTNLGHGFVEEISEGEGEGEGDRAMRGMAGSWDMDASRRFSGASQHAAAGKGALSVVWSKPLSTTCVVFIKVLILGIDWIQVFTCLAPPVLSNF